MTLGFRIWVSNFLNVPNLRFPEFEQHWEEVSLSSLADFKGGGTPSPANINFWKGDIPWISSSDLDPDNINKVKITRYINKEAIHKSTTKLCPAPAILIVSRVAVGKNNQRGFNTRRLFNWELKMKKLCGFCTWSLG